MLSINIASAILIKMCVCMNVCRWSDVSVFCEGGAYGIQGANWQGETRGHVSMTITCTCVTTGHVT